jgi:hypothetical protein
MKPDEHDVVVAELDESHFEAQNAKPNRSFLEQLLSPQSLQWMMACGSGLLMLGFVVWLWTVGIFENPLVIATSTGVATLSVLAAGISMVRKSRYQLAGRWLTLLGALALPLNLWVYDAQGLITLADGGHLWIPAAICCFIYAGVARVLRDSTFVYTLVGGVVMTGMLFLADQTVGRFWTLMPPATFLLSVGWISIFAERFFVENDGDFSRQKFGLAFHRSGMLVVASGLVLLLGGYVAALCTPFLIDIIPSFAVSHSEKVWSLGLIVASAVGFGVQGLLQKYRSYFVFSSALVLAAIPMVLNIFAIPVTVSSIAIFAAALTIAVNLMVAVTKSRATSGPVLAASQIIVALLTMLPIVRLLFHWSVPEMPLLSPIGVWTVIQYVLTAVAAWSIGWNLTVEGRRKHAGQAWFIIGGVVLILSAWTGCWIQALFPAQLFSLAILAIPTAIAVCSKFLSDKKMGGVVGEVASSMMATHLVFLGISQALHLIAVPNAHLVWLASLAVSSVVYWLVSNANAVGMNRLLCYVSSAGSVAILGNWFGLDFGYCLILAPMILGTVIKIADSIWLQGNREGDFVVATPLATAGHSLVLGSGSASVLLAMSRWLEGGTGGTLMLVMMAMLACTTLVSFLTKDAFWRTAFRALIVAIVGSSICVFDGFLKMDGWHRAEICCLIGGAFLLGLGHIAWSREKDGEQDEAATVSLFLGALMLALPMGVGLLLYRTGGSPDDHWRLFHEVGTIVSSLVLLGSGLLCRIRSTTVAGGSLLIFFVGSMVTLIRLPNQLHSVSVMMMVGGGLFFATALLMSIYRDRLVSLPRRVKDGEGVYRILKWR